MITSVVMPQMGLEVTSGIVAAVHVAVGARVAEGDSLLDLETDKALAEVVAPHDGVVRAVEVDVGDTVPLGATLILLSGGGEEAAEEPEAVAARATSAPRTADGRVRAAPVARRAAAYHGVALETVEGTGPRGRITLRDVERAAASGPGVAGGGERKASDAARAVEPAPAVTEPAPPVPAGGRLETMSAMRATIARRMTRSAQIPQFALVREIDASWLLEQKDAVAREAGVGVSDLLLQAMGETLLRHPALAAAYVEPEDGGRPQLRHLEGADVGLAVATARGLLVPVVRGVHERSLAEIGGDRRRLVGAARSGRLASEDMAGAATTLSNLAGFGVDHFTAMLNPGESSILAVGRVVERVVPRGRALVVIPTLALSLTIDHRVADGATGAAALVELAELLEGAMSWRT